MAKIFIPTDYLDSPCKVVENDFIRAFVDDNYIDYVDIFINQDYMIKEGSLSSSYSGSCDVINTYTDDFYYRVDISNVLINVLIISIFGIFIPYKLFMKLFHRRLI